MRKIAILILAAGGSARLGTPKQLLVFRGKTLLNHTVEAAVESRCRNIVIVLGSRAARLRPQLNRQVDVVENRRWRQGPGTSIRAGLRRILRRSIPDGVLICVCDQPFLSAAPITKLLRRFEKGDRSIVASRYGKTRGVPALFGSEWFDALLRLDPAHGAKAIIQNNAPHVATVPFPRGNFDIDTPADYRRLSADSSRGT